MGKVSDVPTASGYVVIPEKEGEISHNAVDGTSTTIVTSATIVELDKSTPRFVASDFLEHIPEARGVNWVDDFFEDHHGYDDIVAVFDFDYDNMESHYQCLGWSCLGVTAVCCPSTIPGMLLALIPCKLNQNVRWNVQAQHIALTRRGILFVHDQRPTGWGEQCCTVGKRTKFIPYEQIAEYNIFDANMKTCSVSSRLTVVNVGIKDSSSSMRIDFEITGLKDPHTFQKVAMALKRYSENHPNASTLSVPGHPAMVMEDRGIANGSANRSNDEVAVLLREIRDELRRNNQYTVQSIPPYNANTATQVQPSAPPENDQ